MLSSWFSGSFVELTYAILGFVILMSIVIFIHEFGHYYIARLCGVRVDVFSIGFGKKIFTRTDRNGCKWALSYIPLGGYVKFYGDKSPVSDTDYDTIDNASDEEIKHSFYHKELWQKLTIVLAGPAANILLCFLILLGIFFFRGISEVKPYVMEVTKGMPAYDAGIKSGDLITKIGSKNIGSVNQVNQEIIKTFGAETSISYLRNDTEYKVDIKPDLINEGDSKKIPTIGISFIFVPLIENVIDNMPAKEAGILPYDRITKINDVNINTVMDVIKFFKNSNGENVNIDIIRDGKVLTKNLIPFKKEQKDGSFRYMIGTSFVSPEASYTRYDLYKSLEHSYKQTFSVASMTWAFFRSIFEGRAHTEHLSGPIKIGEIAGKTLQQSGIVSFLYLMAIISMSIGLINLVPIPMLDGGHAAFYLFEMITRIKPSRIIQEYAFRTGFIFVMLLMAFTILNDLGIIDLLKK